MTKDERRAIEAYFEEVCPELKDYIPAIAKDVPEVHDPLTAETLANFMALEELRNRKPDARKIYLRDIKAKDDAEDALNSGKAPIDKQGKGYVVDTELTESAMGTVAKLNRGHAILKDHVQKYRAEHPHSTISNEKMRKINELADEVCNGLTHLSVVEYAEHSAESDHAIVIMEADSRAMIMSTLSRDSKDAFAELCSLADDIFIGPLAEEKETGLPAGVKITFSFDD